MSSFVNDPPPAPPTAALRHFKNKLDVETDCWAVHEGLKATESDFVVIDVRGSAEFAQGHVPGAINIPYAAIPDAYLARYTKMPTFVVYGAGPHCNRADRAALMLAALELPAKVMVGGFSGWREEGFEIDTGA